jgi:hypothetical protein
MLRALLAQPHFVFGPGYLRAVNRSPDRAIRHALLEAALSRMPPERAKFTRATAETCLAALVALGREDELAQRRKALTPLLSQEAVLYYDRREAVGRNPAASFSTVWCLGLSRTGTTSLHQFLQRSGMLAAHFMNPIAFRLIDRADTRIFDVVSDTSAVHLARLHAMPPTARIIFQTRDFKSWRASFLRHFNGLFGMENADFGAMKALFHSGAAFGWGKQWFDIHEEIYFRFDTLRQAYDAHGRWVAQLVGERPDGVLTLDLDDADKGGKVARFLDIAPGLPFPRANAGRDGAR